MLTVVFKLIYWNCYIYAKVCRSLQKVVLLLLAMVLLKYLRCVIIYMLNNLLFLVRSIKVTKGVLKIKPTYYIIMQLT